LYADFLRIGELFDLESAHVPATVDAFFEYFDHVVEHVLENNAAVQDLLAGSVYRVPPPPGVRIPHLLWVPVRSAVVSAAVEATVATLPPVLRERFGCAPMPGSQLAVQTLHRSSRIVTGLLPRTWRYMPYAAAAIKAARSVPRNESPLDPILFFTTILDQTGDGRVAWSDLLAMGRELATHLDLDEAAEEEVYAAFESWWRQLRDAIGVADGGDGGSGGGGGGGGGEGEGGVVAFTYAQYRAAVDAGRYPGEADALEAGDGIAQVVDVVCRLIDRDGSGKVSADEYARLFSRSPRQYELIAGMRALDRDGDGTVRTDELAAALRAFLTGQRDLPVVRILLGQA
jgi:hypothetical protein